MVIYVFEVLKKVCADSPPPPPQKKHDEGWGFYYEKYITLAGGGSHEVVGSTEQDPEESIDPEEVGLIHAGTERFIY